MPDPAEDACCGATHAGDGMSVIGMEGINECRAAGDSLLQAIRKSWEPVPWLGVRLFNLGESIEHASYSVGRAGHAIGHVGDHLHGMCACPNRWVEERVKV